MSPKRRQAIFDSLQAGNSIRRSWKGANFSGYLSHRLHGIKRLRESEVEQLRKEGIIEVIQMNEPGYSFPFAPYRLKNKAVAERVEGSK